MPRPITSHAKSVAIKLGHGLDRFDSLSGVSWYAECPCGLGVTVAETWYLEALTAGSVLPTSINFSTHHVFGPAIEETCPIPQTDEARAVESALKVS